MRQLILVAVAIVMASSCAFTTRNLTKMEKDPETGSQITTEDETHGPLSERSDSEFTDAQGSVLREKQTADSQYEKDCKFFGLRCTERRATGQAAVMQAMPENGYGYPGMGMPGMMPGMGMGMDAVYLLDSQEAVRKQMLRMRAQQKPMVGQSRAAGADQQGQQSVPKPNFSGQPTGQIGQRPASANPPVQQTQNASQGTVDEEARELLNSQIQAIEELRQDVDKQKRDNKMIKDKLFKKKGG